MHLPERLARPLDNGAQGHCAFEVPAQACALQHGWHLDTVERAFKAGSRSDQLRRIRTLLRRLTIEVFNTSANAAITDGLKGKQKAVTDHEIKKLAQNYPERIRNKKDFINTVLWEHIDSGGGGHGDERVVLALAEGLDIDLPYGESDDVLAAFIEGSKKKYMAFNNGDGHWGLKVQWVS